MKIYVFGNQLVKEDNIPLQVLPKLRTLFPRILFELADPNENFPPKDEKNLIILDTVQGLKKVQILNLNDLSELKKSPNSPHDYDLRMHLLLLKKLKKIDSVKIIGLPEKMGKMNLDQLLQSIVTL